MNDEDKCIGGPMTMNVSLVAQTFTRPEFFEHDMLFGSSMDLRERAHPSMAPDILAEAAGRICYDSFHLPNEKTKENQDYLGNIHKQKHFSVLEHASFSFLITGVSRCLLAEISRHRHFSFSVRSQRYVDEGGSWCVVPDALQQNATDPVVRAAINEYYELQVRSRLVYQHIQEALTLLKIDRKTANDAARYALLEGTETEMFVSANGRAWIEFLAKRDSEGAAIEIRQLAGKISEALKKAAPSTFQGEK